MNQKVLSWILFVPFLLVSITAVQQFGYMGIINHGLVNSAGWQILLDLVIACLLLLTWIIPDAKANNRNPWPFVAITVVLGSFGPLLYLMTKKS